MTKVLALSFFLAALALGTASARADQGDPQVKTDHPWYPGELACSTFERLWKTQAEAWRRVTGSDPATEEEKALASWYWRNLHYYHGEDGRQDLWGKGFNNNQNACRDYWTGLYAYGFAMCGSTHAQWSAEMERLLGHARSRCVGVDGHTSFEVFLTGGPYGDGKWVLLDHDISTVIFNTEGTALLSIPEIKADLKRLATRGFMPERQRGWLVAGLHPEDAVGVYTQFNTAEYLPGYSGPPPMVRLRRGETLRRYLQPGLEDGKTFVFWGRNYNHGAAGPERDRTWVNQPEKMHGSREGTPARSGQARYGNAVYVYTPDFAGTDYREGIVEESDAHVVLEFSTPFVIGATPPNNKPYGLYDAGGKNGLVLRGKATCAVAVSVDRGRTWQDAGAFSDGLDLTDRVKGYRQYLLRLGAGAKALAGTGLSIQTVCQANPAVMPRLKEGGSTVTFEASGRAVVSAGPTLEQAKTHVVEGAFGSPTVTLEVATPRKEPVVSVIAAAQVASGSPPSPDVKYQIEGSVDGGKTWTPIVKDWSIPRRGQEPGDFWSQSFCYGSAEIPESPAAPSLRVRFSNSGRKAVSRAEVHLVYRTGRDSTKVTFDWADDGGPHRESRVFPGGKPGEWKVSTGRRVETRWVEFEPVKE